MRPVLELKTPEQLKTMRRAGLVVAHALREMAAAVAPGVTTQDLDAIARAVLAREGAASNFLGYSPGWGMPPYPATVCTSVNDTVVHGIPGDRALASGDLVSIDFGAVVDGFHGDAAVTVAAGQASPQAQKLSDVTREALWAGIGAARLGGRVGDISAAVERSIRQQGRYGIIRDYTGHGIGTAMHMDPDVPNYGKPRKGPVIVEGLCLAIEPMVTWGSAKTAVLDDEWTIVSQDGSWAAHWEHSITVTRTGLWVLTAEDGGEAELKARGLPFGPLAD
ncbi:MAG: type I methionyl aminopeptidase [Propionibacteriaceae bacterium]|jgi:methionyl aminopeptidase|nr:type I methionyl aminopeptidase [Propionibacteriaceae bacterium]